MFKKLLLSLVIFSSVFYAGCIIRGRVVDQNGAGVAGVTVTLSGEAYMTTTTNSDGYYRFGKLDDMLSVGSYTVTTSAYGYSFTPASRNVTITTQPLEGFGDVPWPVGKVDFGLPPTPQVISTNPVNRAVGVRPNFDWVVITYDRPINAWIDRRPEKLCFDINSEWAVDPVPGDYLWENRVMIPRDIVAHIAGDPDWSDLPLGTTINITLNPPGACSDCCFRDKDNNLLPNFHLQFKVRESVDDAPIEPQVISTDPPNGATDVDPNITSFSITFSKPMAATTRGYFSYGWGLPIQISWSQDGKTVTFTRGDTDWPIPTGYNVALILNNDQYEWWKDTGGNVLEEYTYTFRVTGDLESQMERTYDAEFVEIPADPTRGFYWPYYLGIPNTLKGQTTLLVVPNNTGYPCNDQRYHEIRAKWDLYTFSQLSTKLGVPLLVPTFPRYVSAYLQNLSSIVFQSDLLSKSLERIDLQLIAMIDHANEVLTARNIYPENRVFMTGFSASGQFTTGFTMVHPEQIKASASGGGTPGVPVAEWEGRELRYFEGIADLEELTGKTFDLSKYIQVPQFFYVGDQDFNYTSCTECFAEAEEIYRSVGSDSEFEIYGGLGHAMSEEVWADLQSFFRSYPSSQ